MLQLTDDLREILRDRLGVTRDEVAAFCDRWKIVEFSLFGSVLREDFAAGSDVDVLVTFSVGHGWSLLDMVDLREELAGLFGRRVDVVQPKGLRNPFRRREILGTRRVVYVQGDGARSGGGVGHGADD